MNINKHLTFKNVETACKNIGFKIDTSGGVNILGIRSKGGEFNDIFMYFKYGDLIPIFLPAIYGTTEAGRGYLKEKMLNPKGTAILIHDRQYIDCWQIGKHKTYEALVQSDKAKFTVWRDSNKNGVVDYGGKEYGDVSGLNNHTTRDKYEINSIGTWSAGCQVIWNANSFFNVIMPFCKETKQTYFTYGLFLDETFLKLIK